ncbi:hypothetical protein F5Y06DRAFT_274596 [Hypoxylon sp. FL0890]|nr:hypothetical protein F5Y06DRAFT_274596 [Hypoxylon sp. FL0890]
MACLLCPGRRRRRPKKAIPYEWIYPPPRPQQQPPIPRHPQSQSPLFGKLPVELRLEVFRLALDCSPIPVHTKGLPRFVGLQNLGVGGPQVTAVCEARLLSLLMTCSRAYAEALPVLYSVNTFSMGSSDTVSLLAAASYASWIRRLEFVSLSGMPPISVQRPDEGWIERRLNRRFFQGEEFCRAAWLKTWEDMRKLEGLRWLHVKVRALGSWAEAWRKHEMEVLMPLRGLLKDEAYGKLTVNWDRPAAQGTAAEDILKEWVIERLE